MVIGGGPSGIITIAMLLQRGLNKKDILWIDQEFKVGRLGKYYANVPSNRKISQYLHFFNNFNFLKQINLPSIEKLKKYDPNYEPLLKNLIIDPLQEITNYLQEKVFFTYDTVDRIIVVNSIWNIITTKGTFLAQKVILATGSYPKTFSYEGFEEIPMDIAIDKQKLTKTVNNEDKIIVVGSGNSALLILKYLSEIPVKLAINFYSKKPFYGPNGIEGIIVYFEIFKITI